MNYKVGYFLPANENVYDVVRRALPDGMELVGIEATLVHQAIETPQDFIDAFGVAKIAKEAFADEDVGEAANEGGASGRPMLSAHSR